MQHKQLQLDSRSRLLQESCPRADESVIWSSMRRLGRVGAAESQSEPTFACPRFGSIIVGGCYICFVGGTAVRRKEVETRSLQRQNLGAFDFLRSGSLCLPCLPLCFVLWEYVVVTFTVSAFPSLALFLSTGLSIISLSHLFVSPSLLARSLSLSLSLSVSEFSQFPVSSEP